MSAFDDALRLTLKYEGGKSDDRDDRGGLTMYGITQAVYNRWRRGRGLFARPVTEIEDLELRTIYRDEYWTAAHCDDLPDQLAKCVFDAAVNHGPQRAIKLLQTAVGAGADGRFGPMTRAAVDTSLEQQAITNYLDARADFYTEIIERDPTQVRFAHGWDNRVAALRSALLGVYGEA